MKSWNHKILMIEPLGDGGIAHYTYNLIKALQEESVDVSLYTARRYEFKGQIDGIHVYARMFKAATYLTGKIVSLDRETFWPSVFRRLIKVIEYPFNVIGAVRLSRSLGIQVVHLQSVNIIELLMVLLFRCINKKVIFTIHNVLPRHKKLLPYHCFLYRILYGLCHRIIIHTNSGKQEVIDLFKINSQRICVVPHGNYNFFVPEEPISYSEAQNALGLTRISKTILFFGAIRESKGLDLILRAMPLIRDKINNVKLLIVGEIWENWSKYQKIIDELEIEENIFLELGYVSNDDISKYFFAADMIVMPYRSITQSGVLQVAYAFGKPVLTTDLPGFREAVNDGVNGFLVPLGDIELLAARTVDVLADDELQKRMGANSLRLSQTKFSWEDIAIKTKNIYQSAVEGI